MKLGIIGSAGRREDGNKLNRIIFYEMVKEANRLLSKNTSIDTLVSGGAAYADFCAVVLFNQYLNTINAQKLILHLPCEWDFNKRQFLDTGEFDWKTNPGGTCNFYHRKFEKKTDVKSLHEMHKAIENGAKVVVTKGLHNRNTEVAKNSDVLLAMSYGSNGKVADGGTKDCCIKWMAFGKDRNNGHHLDLNTMILHKLEV